MNTNRYSVSTVLLALTILMVSGCKPAPEAQQTATADQAVAAKVDAEVAVAEPAPADRPAGGMAGGMGRGGGNPIPPPPKSKDGSREAMIPAGTVAPDGIGVTLRDGSSPNPYTKDSVTYVPWEEGTILEPIAAGSPFPAGSVAFAKDGSELDLNASVASKPTMLIYYRGGWCPYCNAHLRELQNSVPALEEMGYQLLAVSTDTVEALKEYDDSEYSYTLLADPDLALATSLGLKYKVVQQYIDHVKAIPRDTAFDMNERNGGYSVTPAAFIIDTVGTIRFVYANDNYTVRASQESLLNAAKEALQ